MDNSSSNVRGSMPNAQRSAQTATILWMAMLMAEFVYGFVAYMKLSANTGGESVIAGFPAFDFSNPFVVGLTVVAVMTFGMSFVLPKILLQMQLKKLGSNRPDTEGRYRMFLVPFIVRLALTEAVAIYGLVMCYIVGNNGGFVFMIVALLGFLNARPTPEKVDALFET